MKKRKAAYSGYLTVFLTLCLTCMVSLCLVLIQGIRSNSVKTESQIAADIGMNSILAEYHRELFEQYDLLFVDTSYGTAVPSTALVSEHLKEYLNKNLSGRDLVLSFLYQDFLNMKAESVEVESICMATDESGKILRRQAVEYMSDQMGASFLDEMVRWFDTVNQYTIDMHELTEMRVEIAEQIKPFFEKLNIMEENQWSEEVFQNIIFQRDSDILDLCMMIFSDEFESLSKSQVDISQYVSARKINKGNGMNPNVTYQDSFLEQCLFQEYLMEKTGNYRNPSSDSPLQYQTEYLIGGMSSDVENLAAVISELMLMRQAANITYLLSDEIKMEGIKAVSEVIATLLEAPGAETVIEGVIILCWSFSESFYDVRTLLAGGTVPLLKTKEDWFLDMEAFLNPDNYFHFTTPMYDTGLSYAEYLRILLYFQDISTKTIRFMDIVEMNIRQTPGNTHFRMDGCADGICFNIQIKAKGGRNYNIVRWCGYY